MLQRFKQKLKDGVSSSSSNGQDGANSEEEVKPAMLAVSATVAKSRHKIIREKVPPDEELLENLDSGYSDASFDATRSTLNALPADKILDTSTVDSIRSRKFHELRAVSKQLSTLVLGHQNEFMTEIQRVAKLDEQLTMVLVVCKNERRHLARVEKDVTNNLQALHKQQKKAKMMKLLQLLQGIKIVRTASTKLSELLEKKQYVDAIELYQQCNMLMELNYDFDCISELLSSLGDAESIILQHLEDDMKEIIQTSFDEDAYEKIVHAYRVIGQPTLVLDQICTYIPSVVVASAKKVLTKYLQGFGGRLSYREYCENVVPSKASKALIHLCTAMCDVMVHFNDFYEYHMKDLEKESVEDAPDKEEQQDIDEEEEEDNGSNDSEETTHSHRFASVSSRMMISSEEYTKIKLNHAKAKLWQDIQRHVGIFLSTVNFSSLPFADYLKVLKKVSVLIQIGESYTNQQSIALTNAMQEQALAYVQAFHHSMAAELVREYNKEDWQPTTVKKDFNIFLEKEYLFLRRRNQTKVSEDGTVAMGDENTDMITLQNFIENKSLFEDSKESISKPPKDNLSKGKQPPSVSTTSSTTPLSSTSSAPTSASRRAPPPPHCSPTTLTLAKNIGYYLEMMFVLKPLSWNVFECLIELVYLYVYIVFNFFGTDNPQYNESILPASTRQLLERSKQTFSNLSEPEDTRKKIAAESEQDSSNDDGVASLAVAAPTTMFETPKLSESVPLDSQSNMYAIDCRVCGVEGLMFLSTVLKSLKKHFLSRLPDQNETVHKYFQQNVDRFSDIRLFIYKTAVDRVLDSSLILKLMSSAKFDRKEITTDHSHYVDEMIQHFNEINGRLQTFGENRLPSKARELVWAELLLQTSRLFVEGFSLAKKCTNEGRALMQLDLRQFLNKIEKFTSVKPNVDVVQNYITAFYLQEGEFTEWVHTNYMNYSHKQLLQLVHVMFSKRAMRSKFKALIDEKFSGNGQPQVPSESPTISEAQQ